MPRTLALPLAALLCCFVACNDPPGLCANVTCGLSQACDSSSGMCLTTSICVGVSCPSGLTCDGTFGSPTAGTCVMEACGAMMCKNGQVCDAGSLTCVNPSPPALGIQIDRAGRPLVNTMLTNPFGLYKPVTATAADSTDQTQVAYNADVGPAATWIRNWSPAIGQHLAYFDGLDGLCSSAVASTNQLGFGQVLAGYGLLTNFFADDELLVDSTRGSCKTYLAVEQKAAGVANTDCGGRTLDEDVVDATYTLLTNPTVPLSDGVARTTATASGFPYLQPPQ